MNLSGSVPQAGMMVVSPDKKFTMVYSPSNNALVLVDDHAETVVASGNSSLPAVILPGPTESVFISKFNTLGYAAVPPRLCWDKAREQWSGSLFRMQPLMHR